MFRLILALITSLLLITACDKGDNAVIVLSREPINPHNMSIVQRRTVFQPLERIYYILLSEDPIPTQKLRLQVLKLDKKFPYYGIKPAYGIDIDRGKETHYVTDYITLHSAGTYVIRIFSFENLEEPIAETEFQVDPL